MPWCSLLGPACIVLTASVLEISQMWRHTVRPYQNFFKDWTWQNKCLALDNKCSVHPGNWPCLLLRVFYDTWNSVCFYDLLFFSEQKCSFLRLCPASQFYTLTAFQLNPNLLTEKLWCAPWWWRTAWLHDRIMIWIYSYFWRSSCLLHFSKRFTKMPRSSVGWLELWF